MPREAQKLAVIRQVRGIDFAEKAATQSQAYRDTCYQMAAGEVLDRPTARNDEAAAKVGIAVGSLRFDAAKIGTFATTASAACSSVPASRRIR